MLGLLFILWVSSPLEIFLAITFLFLLVEINTRALGFMFRDMQNRGVEGAELDLNKVEKEIRKVVDKINKDIKKDGKR